MKNQQQQQQQKQEEDDQRSNSSNNEDSEFENERDAEDFVDYRVDGYHPVYLGEKFNDKYVVIQKLGWGHFSTVWLVNEINTQNYYALKIQKSKKSYAEAAIDELEILKALSTNIENPEWHKIIEEYNKLYKLNLTKNDNFNVKLVDNFIHYGMHGKHYCAVFEIMGPTLLDLIQYFEDRDRGMDIQLTKIITRQILIGLDYMHRICNVIHTDLKPENIMMELPPDQLKLLIEDLKKYKKKPLSMKFLKKLQERSKKNKKKNQKKKEKKQQAEGLKDQPTEPNKPNLDDTSTKTSNLETDTISSNLSYNTSSNNAITNNNESYMGIMGENSNSQSLPLNEGSLPHEPFSLENSSSTSLFHTLGLDNMTSQLEANTIKEVSNPNHMNQHRMEEEKKALIIKNEELNHPPSLPHHHDGQSLELHDHSHEHHEHPHPHLQTQYAQQMQIIEADKTIKGIESMKLEKCPAYKFQWKNHMITLDENIRIKIVDFGNGCWIHKHFTDNIQTREYRSPEAILGINYKPNTDIWSLACVVFEMLTSSFLFKPHKGDTYSKDDDHLALMIEHLGKFPKLFALKGKESRNYFNKSAQLIRIKDLKQTNIAESLVHANKLIDPNEAKKIEEFLLPMLEYDPEKRVDAKVMLQAKWVQNIN